MSGFTARDTSCQAARLYSGGDGHGGAEASLHGDLTKPDCGASGLRVRGTEGNGNLTVVVPSLATLFPDTAGEKGSDERPFCGAMSAGAAGFGVRVWNH